MQYYECKCSHCHKSYHWASDSDKTVCNYCGTGGLATKLSLEGSDMEQAMVLGRIVRSSGVGGVIPKGTSPLPYVQVGMLISTPYESVDAPPYKVIAITYSGGTLTATIDRGAGPVHLDATHVRARWVLDADFDPNVSQPL